MKGNLYNSWVDDTNEDRIRRMEDMKFKNSILADIAISPAAKVKENSRAIAEATIKGSHPVGALLDALVAKPRAGALKDEGFGSYAGQTIGDMVRAQARLGTSGQAELNRGTEMANRQADIEMRQDAQVTSELDRLIAGGGQDGQGEDGTAPTNRISGIFSNEGQSQLPSGVSMPRISGGAEGSPYLKQLSLKGRTIEFPEPAINAAIKSQREAKGQAEKTIATERVKGEKTSAAADALVNSLERTWLKAKPRSIKNAMQPYDEKPSALDKITANPFLVRAPMAARGLKDLYTSQWPGENKRDINIKAYRDYVNGLRARIAKGVGQDTGNIAYQEGEWAVKLAPSMMDSYELGKEKIANLREFLDDLKTSREQGFDTVMQYYEANGIENENTRGVRQLEAQKNLVDKYGLDINE